MDWEHILCDLNSNFTTGLLSPAQSRGHVTDTEAEYWADEYRNCHFKLEDTEPMYAKTPD